MRKNLLAPAVLALSLAFSLCVRAENALPANTAIQSAPAEKPKDGAPLTRIAIEQLLEPTSTPALRGNESTAPNAHGQYTLYALEVKAQELAAYLQAGQYAPISEYIAKLRDERTQTTDGMSAATSLCSMLMQSTNAGELARQWISKEPDSQIAYMLYGIWCIDEAWRYRGGGWANSVTDEGWQGFYKYLQIAQNSLAEALQLDPDDYICAAQMITVSLGLGQSRAERHKWFERATTIYPDYYEAYSWLYTSLLPRWGGFPAEARLFTQHNASRGPQFPLLYFNWMYTENNKEYSTSGSKVADEAWAILEKYSESFPDSGMAYRNMASMQLNFRNNQQAVADAKKSVELDPSGSNRYIYARALHAVRENEQSIAELKTAIALSPNQANYWDWLGRNYFTIKARNMPLAIECFTRAIELHSSSKWLLVDRGRCYMTLGNFEQALPNFEAAVKQWPDFDQAYYNLGTALFRTGNKEAAQQAFDRAIELNESNKARVDKFISQHGG